MVGKSNPKALKLFQDWATVFTKSAHSPQNSLFFPLLQGNPPNQDQFAHDCIHHHQINHLATDLTQQLTPGKQRVSNASDFAASLAHLIDFQQSSSKRLGMRPTPTPTRNDHADAAGELPLKEEEHADKRTGGEQHTIESPQPSLPTSGVTAPSYAPQRGWPPSSLKTTHGP